MKSLLLSSAIAAVLLFVGTGSSWAHYDHDHSGWYDEHHHHHAYTHYHGHRGYWDRNDSGARIWISI